MREMRRSDRMITDREEIVDVLDSCKVFRMAVHDEEGMYIVPLNFGYTYEDGCPEALLPFCRRWQEGGCAGGRSEGCHRDGHGSLSG